MFQLNTAYPDSRFYVSIDDKPLGLFTEISGLEIDIDVTEYPEGGNNTFVHRLPGRAKVNNLVLKRGMAIAADFEGWLMDVSLGKIKRRHVTVTMYDASSLPLQSWNFLNTYPVKWSGPQLRVTQGTAAVETLELAYGGSGGGPASAGARGGGVRGGGAISAGLLRGENGASTASAAKNVSSAEQSSPVAVDLEELTDRVYALLQQEIRLAQARRGYPTRRFTDVSI